MFLQKEGPFALNVTPRQCFRKLHQRITRVSADLTVCFVIVSFKQDQAMQEEVLDVCASPISDDSSLCDLFSEVSETTAPTLANTSSSSTENIRPDRPQRHRERRTPSPWPTTPRHHDNTPQEKFLPVHLGLCWRCGGTGHQRSHCRRERQLFCSRCGRIGTMSRRCSCPEASTSRQHARSGERSLPVHDMPPYEQRRRASACATCGCPYLH